MRAIRNIALTIVLVLVAAVGPAVAQGKPIRIGEINSYSGLATVYTFPYKKWAHISPDYEYGHNVWDEFIAYLKQLKPDVQVVQQNWPKLGETDHSSYITALLQSGADAFLSSVWGAQEIAFVKQARPFGLFDKVHYVSASVGNPDELDPLGKEAPVGALTPGFAWDDDGMQKRHPKLAEWVKKYADRTKGKEP